MRRPSNLNLLSLRQIKLHHGIYIARCVMSLAIPSIFFFFHSLCVCRSSTLTPSFSPASYVLCVCHTLLLYSPYSFPNLSSSVALLCLSCIPSASFFNHLLSFFLLSPLHRSPTPQHYLSLSPLVLYCLSTSTILISS